MNHRDDVSALAWSPDNRWLASGSRDGVVKIWDAQTLALARARAAHSMCVTSVAWSPDSRVLATASLDATVCLWNVPANTIEVLRQHTQAVRRVAWCGAWLATCSDDTLLCVWSTHIRPGGAQLAGSAKHGTFVSDVSWLGESRLLTACDRHVYVWLLNNDNNDNNIRLRHKTLFPDRVRRIAVRDATRVAVALDSLTVVDVCLPADLPGHICAGHTSLVSVLEWSPVAYEFMSASFDGTIQVWSAGARRVIVQARGAPSVAANIVVCAAWSPDGTRIAFGEKCHVSFARV